MAQRLEHDPEKACPGLGPGWKPVFRKGLCSSKKLERQSIQSKAIALWPKLRESK
jgi:hypothetical protein